jgi:hypothetical protein
MFFYQPFEINEELFSKGLRSILNNTYSVIEVCGFENNANDTVAFT